MGSNTGKLTGCPSIPGCDVECKTPTSSASEITVESLKIGIFVEFIFLIESATFGEIGASGKVDCEVTLDVEIDDDEELDRFLENKNSAGKEFFKHLRIIQYNLYY